MKRILLDENIDQPLLQGLFAPEFAVMTVRERGWIGKQNGDLLRQAEKEFDVLITMDKNLEHQQNLSALNLAVLILRAKINAYSVIAPMMPKVNAAVRIIYAAKWSM